ncbi:PREDICTED: uncharacterized protein LOC104799318 [Tarenaya hassleriana]|uniref:uncharacterized protein LOC104799318 n=1 Tax=Tarenaya hassleriana TaxID=28532 RepID=UPI00053C723F|nr:PREDICTED: uncharacterized protein LOC104799318 [Tarenaya hassleriana]
MKKFERPRSSSSGSQTRRPANFGRKDQTPRKANGSKPLNAAQLVSKVLDATTTEPSVSAANDSTSESSEIYDTVNVHYMDDARSSVEDTNEKKMNGKSDANLEDSEDGNDDGSSKDSVSSAEDKRPNRQPWIVSKSRSSQDRPVTSKGRTDAESIRSRPNTFHGITPRMSTKLSKGQAKVTTDFTSHRISTEYEKSSAESPQQRYSKEIDHKPFEEDKEDDVWEDAENDTHTAESDNESVAVKESKKSEAEEVLIQKIGTLEARMEELEEELRDVASLEISLYSVSPEHGISSDKLYKPARDLSRLYTIARKSQSESKLVAVSKNIMSGLFLVSKSCGTDVPRLTFWLSNIVVFREFITREFGGENVNGSKPVEEDWKDVRTLLAEIRKLETLVFTRAVESIWSQVLMTHLKPRGEDTSVGKRIRSAKFSDCVTLWENSFEEALHRLCPVQTGQGNCGCLPVLTKMVMEKCIARLDIAMFNAILRESAHQIPTDAVSDPIGDPRLLPITAGVLSFESGVKLKNAVGYWSRSLLDIYDIGSDDSPEAEHHNSAFKPFKLLNELSDLLMIPKDTLTDHSTREEVCPSIGLSLVKRILCNFTPDEFCPDPVPGTVLEELNAQSILEGRSYGNPTIGFPRRAAPVLYTPPSASHLTETTTEFSGRIHSSKPRRNGYNSDEEEEEEWSCFPRNNNRFRPLKEVHHL